MKCDEAQKVIAVFIQSLPRIEHVWDNISRTEDTERWICRHCLQIEERTLSNDGSSNE